MLTMLLTCYDQDKNNLKSVSHLHRRLILFVSIKAFENEEKSFSLQSMCSLKFIYSHFSTEN